MITPHHAQALAHAAARHGDDPHELIGVAMLKNIPAEQSEHLALFRKVSRQALHQHLGRAPTGDETLLAHDLGALATAQLLHNPKSPAVAIVGPAMLKSLGGHPGMTGADFVEHLFREPRRIVEALEKHGR